MKIKKMIAITLSLSLIGAVFTGCGAKNKIVGSSETTTKTIKAPSDDTDITNKFTDTKLLAMVRKAIGKEENGTILYKDVKNTNYLSIGQNPDEESIKSLNGLEYFTNLETLSLSYFSMKDMDFHNNTKLKNLQISSITSVKVNTNGNPELEVFAVNIAKDYEKPDTTIEVNLTHNAKLKNLTLVHGKITNLDLSKNTALEKLELWNNKLTKVDLTKNTNLKDIKIHENPSLTNIDLSKNINLKEVDLEENHLSKIDFSSNEKVTDIYIGNNPLSGTLDLSKNKELKALNFDHSQITEVHLSKDCKIPANRTFDSDAGKVTKVLK